MTVRSAMNPGPDDLDVLYSEIDKLPERYRRPIVLCDVDAYTYEEAAKYLGWPVGTVKSRISRGRSKLELVLRRRGFGVPVERLFAGVFVKGARIAPSASLVDVTARAATLYATGASTAAVSIPAAVKLLTEGVLMTMFLTKVKMVALTVLSVGLGTLATGVVARQPNFDRAVVTDRSQNVETNRSGKHEPSEHNSELTPKSVMMLASQTLGPGVTLEQDKRVEPKKPEAEVSPLTKEQLVNKVPNFFMFDYPFDPQPGKRIWLRVDDKHFAERYPDGTENRFLIMGHAKVRGIEGTIVSRVAGDPEKIQPSEQGAYQTFIPDKGNEEMAIFNRWLPSEWRDMSWSLKMPTIIRRVE